MVTDWKQIYMNMNTTDKFSCTQTSMERMNTFCCLCWNKVSFCGIIAIFTAFLKWLTKKWKCACIIYICQVNIEEWYQQMKQQFLFEEKKEHVLLKYFISGYCFKSEWDFNSAFSLFKMGEVFGGFQSSDLTL